MFMKYIISKTQIRNLFEQPKPISDSIIVKLFRFLNEEKKKHRKRADLLEVIKNLMPYMGIPEGYELYLLELYLLNYNKDGDYSSLTKNNFIDPRKQRGKTTPNTLADLYTIAQLPFKGSNLEGYWSEDTNRVPFYVVTSYGWYPIYIFKNDRWYQVSRRYSSSTSRHVSNANPIEWNEDLLEKVTILTPDEMRMLMRGVSHDQVMKNKLTSIKKSEEDLKSKRVTAKDFRYRWWEEENQNFEPYKVKFKISSIDTDDEKATVTVDIYDVVAKDNQTQGPDRNYLKNEIKGASPKEIERKLQEHLKYKFEDYIGSRLKWGSDLPQSSKVVFNFNHLKK